MTKNRLLQSFLPGFAPILIYILVESLFGETAGLSAGLALGIGEFSWILARERRVDAFTLVDTILLACMGAVSLALSDPVFFRLKPAVSGAVLACMMILGSLGPHRLFLPYLERKTGMGDIPASAAKRMLAMIAGFGALTLAHSVLTAVAALFWSKGAWNFVAGALFWILALCYLAAWTVPAMVAGARANGRNRAHASKRDARTEGDGELLPVVDENGCVIGAIPRPLCHLPLSPDGAPRESARKPLHPVVRLWLSDGQGGFWMQKRSMTKLVQPGKWDCAVGGHIAFGETAESSLNREAFEEIGLSDIGHARPLSRFVHETAIERELVFVYAGVLSDSSLIRPDGAEVDEVRLWTVSELRAELSRDERDGSLTGLARAELGMGLIP